MMTRILATIVLCLFVAELVTAQAPPLEEPDDCETGLVLPGFQVVFAPFGCLHAVSEDYAPEAGNGDILYQYAAFLAAREGLPALFVYLLDDTMPAGVRTNVEVPVRANLSDFGPLNGGSGGSACYGAGDIENLDLLGFSSS